MTIFKEGHSENTIQHGSIHAKESTNLLAAVNHTRVTGTQVGTKFCLDSCITNPATNPVNTVKKTAANIRQINPTPAADTEFTIVFPIGTKGFILKDQAGNAETRISTTPGGADPGDATFFTIPNDGSYQEEGMNLTAALTLYCQSDKAGRIIEIWEWT